MLSGDVMLASFALVFWEKGLTAPEMKQASLEGAGYSVSKLDRECQGCAGSQRWPWFMLGVGEGGPSFLEESFSEICHFKTHAVICK